VGGHANVRVTANERYAVALDYDVNNNLVYHGIAKCGSSKSAAVWCVKKLTYSGENLTDIQFADGNERFDNVWDDRASLTYL